MICPSFRACAIKPMRRISRVSPIAYESPIAILIVTVEEIIARRCSRNKAARGVDFIEAHHDRSRPTLRTMLACLLAFGCIAPKIKKDRSSADDVAVEAISDDSREYEP